MQKKNLSGICLLFCLLTSWSSLYAQFEIPEKPQKQTSVYDDEIGLLSPGEKAALEDKLIKYADSTSTQIVTIIISSTKGEDINYLGAQWGQKWGIGQADKDNGILILLAKDDRQVAISTGYGTEHLLTDALSKRIIQNIMIPYFKTGDYYSGLNRASDAIFSAMSGEYEEERDFTYVTRDEFPYQALIPIIIFILIMIILSRSRRGGGKGGNRGNRSPAMDLLDIIILSNMGKGGYGRSSGGGFGGGGSFGGGGGFGGGFGGGGFGGGGASGGW